MRDKNPIKKPFKNCLFFGVVISALFIKSFFSFYLYPLFTHQCATIQVLMKIMSCKNIKKYDINGKIIFFEVAAFCF